LTRLSSSLRTPEAAGLEAHPGWLGSPPLDHDRVVSLQHHSSFANPHNRIGCGLNNDVCSSELLQINPDYDDTATACTGRCLLLLTTNGWIVVRAGWRPGGGGEEMTVLIADDSEALVQRLVGALAELSGIEIVGQAGTVEDASRAVRDLKPDVVILDIRMPGGSGIDVLEGIKRDRVTPVVIVLTNYGYPQYRKKCLQSGAQFFLDKSSEFEKVSEVLRSLVAARGAEGASRAWS